VEKFSKNFSKSLSGLEPDALEALSQHRWPGNIRELENAMERAVALESGEKISLSSLEGSIQGSSMAFKDSGEGIEFPDLSRGAISLSDFLARVEAELVRRALRHCSQDASRTAQLLKTTPERIAAVTKSVQ
jgi:two-component system response regulator PilR (NtrC family)